MHGAIGAAGLGTVRHAMPAGGGRRNDVWRAETAAGDDVVVRLLADDGRRAMEVAVMARAAAAGVPVAEVLWSSSGPPAVTVQRRLGGQRLADVEPTEELCASVATTMAAIHAVGVEGGFGSLTADLVGEEARMSTWFTERARAEADAVAVDAEDRSLVEATLARFDAAAELLDAQVPVLVHGDLQPHNLLVDGDRVVGVLDWEAAKAGPPAFDLGWWDWFSAAWSTPWPTDRMLAHYDPGGDVDELRELVVDRVWLRELLGAVRAPTGDAGGRRAAAARRGLSRPRGTPRPRS